MKFKLFPVERIFGDVQRVVRKQKYTHIPYVQMLHQQTLAAFRFGIDTLTAISSMCCLSAPRWLRCLPKIPRSLRRQAGHFRQMNSCTADGPKQGQQLRKTH